MVLRKLMAEKGTKPSTSSRAQLMYHVTYTWSILGWRQLGGIMLSKMLYI